MIKNPKTIDYREMAVNVLQVMNDNNKITCMPVINENIELVGFDYITRYNQGRNRQMKIKLLVIDVDGTLTDA